MLSILSLLVVLGLALAACSGGGARRGSGSGSDRTGGWVDEIIFTSIDQAEAAVTQLQADEIDIYAYSVNDPNVFRTVQADPNLAYSNSSGTYDALLFNPHGPTFLDGRLNPFSNPKIREAMNWLINRDYVVQEIVGGLGVARFFPLTTSFPDYAKYADICRGLEAYYAYDPVKAGEIVGAEMEAMGASLVDGKWQYEGQPVVLIGIIRTEDERNQIGDYFANQLESVGFTVDRQYKSRTEASPIWNQSDPAEGQWHWYTAGWINEFVARDEGIGFAVYTPRWSASPTWQAMAPSAELDAVELRLETNDYASEAERRQLFAQALPLGMQDSAVVFVIDTLSFTPRDAKLQIGYDLAAGVNASEIWPYTIRWTGEEGGVVRMAQPGIMVEPWNPVNGTNWVYDGIVQRATQDKGVMFDPYTGLMWPLRIERGEIVAREGLTMRSTLDWVDLSFAPEVRVPDDAWVDWDAASQRFVTAAEKYPEGVTSEVKITVYYPEDLFETVTWHDGSPISVGDFVMWMIMNFDPGKPESPIYDEGFQPTVDALLTHFKGVRIVSTDPLVIETYEDQYNIDAEITFNLNTWYPLYTYGMGAWHNVALGVMAEEAGTLAFSTAKATANEIDWMSFIAGPSLEILKGNLDAAQEQEYVPYAATLGEFVSADEIELRYENLQAFYESYGHFWLGTGPYYLKAVYPVEQTLTLARYEDYPDPADRWSGFGAPKIAVVEVEGESQVAIGQEAAFDAYVTFQGAPYPSTEIADVSFLVFNAQNELIGNGAAELVADGQYRVVLGEEVTSQLTAGGGKIEVIVVSTMVGLPTFASFEFVAVAP
jgi:peptide/nickel transport system substrate-binding protein